MFVVIKAFALGLSDNIQDIKLNWNFRKTVNNISVIVLDRKGTMEMGKVQEGKKRVATLTAA